MKPSKELQSQLDRLSRSGSFAVSMTMKKELKAIVLEIGCAPLTNMDCGTCVRKAMHDVNSYMKRIESKPVLQMKMVKSETEMTYKEMRRFAKAKGHRLKNPTKEQLIKIIQNEN